MEIRRFLMVIVTVVSMALTAGAQQYMDILQKYAPYYAQNCQIVSSELRSNSDEYNKNYRYIASTGLQIDLTVSFCRGCNGSGRSVFGNCFTCMGSGAIIFATAYQPKNGAMFNRESQCTSGGGFSALESGSDADDGGTHIHAKPQSKRKLCPSCSGAGFCTKCRRSGTVMYNGSVQTCPRCNGTGGCSMCGNKGSVN